MPIIACLQHAMTPSVEENLAKGLALMEGAAKSGAKLVAFPEVHLSPFFPKHKGAGGKAEAAGAAYAMTLDSPAVKAIGEAAGRLGLVVVANIYWEAEGRRFDASPVFDADGSLLGVSRMVRIAHFDGFWEKDYYAPGDAIRVYDTAIGKVGVVICFDRHFPESMRAAALQGAEIVATPTCNEVGEPLELFGWEMRVQALHNHVYSMLINRCGREEDRLYAGLSLIAGPEGEEIARAGTEEEILLADVDLARRAAIAAERGWVAEAADRAIGA